MKTDRGFVLKIEIGRGGLVTVTVLFEDGSTGLFVIEDLDGDPERFNERLSMLAVLRDAMNKAEPVEFQHEKGDPGEVFIRVARISRDSLATPLKIEAVTGLVSGAVLFTENRPSTPSEKADIAKVGLLALESGQGQYVLDMQTPERAVAVQQFEMIRSAHQSGQFVRLYVESQAGKAAAGQRIHGVAVLTGYDPLPDDRAKDVSGFVEALSLIPLGIVGEASSNFAVVRFTTAPEFKGAGGTVGLEPFTPVTLTLLTPKGSLAYQLFEAGLRDNLRMRVRAMLVNRPKPDKEVEPGTEGKPAAGTKGNTEKSAPMLVTNMKSETYFRAFANMSTLGKTSAKAMPDGFGLVFNAELLAHLASASRPVWVTISRKSLDHGPEGYSCTTGVPSSDLTPRTLRDLHIPYPAEWCGIGCFNPGVYCFQLKLPTDFQLLVDGRKLCLYDSTEAGIKMGYACLEGCHEVCVKIDNWVCEYEFVMDVYQLR